MDDITHTLLAASAACIVFWPRLGRWSIPIGGLAGIAPDGDFFLTSLADPAMPWEFHRHFTHALAFTPAGAFVAALPFLFLPPFRGKRWSVLAAAAIGYATHGLLDACTSWGTRLLWPFSSARVSWDIIAIIDPLFTLPLLVGVVWALIAKSSRPMMIGLVCAMLYMILGVIQHQRGLAVQENIAQRRGNRIERGRVMPTFGSLIIWRSIYESNGELHADAIRLPPLGAAEVKQGKSLPVFGSKDLPPGAPARVLSVFEKFEHFADGYTAAISDRPLIIGDMRYSAQMAGFAPLWGIRVELGTVLDPEISIAWQPMMPDRRTALLDLWRQTVDGDEYEVEK